MPKRYIFIILTLLGLATILAACGGAAPDEVNTVEVTRVVTETVDVESEIIEEPAAEAPAEEAIEEAEEEAIEEAVGDDFSAIGSEDATGDSPPPPNTGPKVESTRTTAAPTDEVIEAEVRSADSDGETAVAEAPLTTAADEPVSLDLTLDQGSRLTAGEVDDNTQWDDYLLYLRNYSGAAVMQVDVSERHQILVTDSQGNPVLGARIGVEANGEEVMVLRTHSNGRSLFFPRALPPEQQSTIYNLSVNANGSTQTFTIQTNDSQREWTIIHPGADQLPTTVNLDVMFLIDATGSMSDEIFQLKENIRAIAAQIDALPSQPNVRFGMVTYRDREDAYLTQVTDFTPDVESFANALAQVQAEGGGDYPEDLNEALYQSIHQTEWRIENTVSLIFLVADAPPSFGLWPTKSLRCGNDGSKRARHQNLSHCQQRARFARGICF